MGSGKCYVIVTTRSLLWTLLSLAALTAVLSAFITPRWLVGSSTFESSNSPSQVRTVGIFNRCTLLNGRKNCANFNFDGLATDTSTFPGCWKASFFFISLGLAVMATTILAALVGSCIQSVGRKSIFDLAGVGQAIAGILYLLGMILYPAGWGAKRVQNLCGREADAFYMADCSLGWAFYCAIIGIALTFFCAVLSGQAEKSTASDQVQDELNDGKTLICLA